MYYDRLSYNINEFILTSSSHNVRFKGGGGDPAPPPSSAMADTEIKKYARSTLYPMVSQGMKGEGFGTPELTAQRSTDMYRGLNLSYERASSDLQSNMSRTIDPEDTRVKDFMSQSLNRAYVTGKDNISRSIRQEKVSDIDVSQGMAADYLAGEKRMAIGGAQMYNQALQQNIMDQQRMGTFNTNVAAGVGSGAMDYYFAQKMGA